MSRLTVVMYHHVQEPDDSPYSRLPGLTPLQFQRQLDHLEQNYSIVSLQQVFDSLRGESLPERALLLTFDDAYAEHYTLVFPLLQQRKLPACFFPPAQALEQKKLLDVHKVHAILARDPGAKHCAEFLRAKVSEATALHSRFDSPDVLFVKRVLQRAPERAQYLDSLFTELVPEVEALLATRWYFSFEQLREMVRGGMEVGSHGWAHPWLDTCGPAEQELEIDRGLALLTALGVSRSHWAFAYPYGAFDSTLLKSLEIRGASVAFTTEVGVADLTRMDRLRLPRLDTNDFPK